MTTKEKIIHGATDVFLQKGFAGARMQEIADKAGLNKALLHYHYGTKEELFKAILTTAFLKLMPMVFASLNSDKPLREKLASTVSVYFDAISMNPALPLFVLTELNNNPEFIRERVPAQHDMLNVFYQQVDDGNASGEVFPVDALDIIADIIGLSIIAFIGRPMIQTVSSRSDDEYESFIASRKAHVTSLLINGLFRRIG
jgi:TetR/AcrR family transcriptional regulator